MGNMMGFGAGDYGWSMGLPLWLLSALPLVLVWSIFWKGLALWHSAQRREVIWFVAFLFINTLGILEILYLFMFAKLKVNELFTKETPVNA